MSRLVMFQLTESEQHLLLRVARDSVQSHLLREPLRLPQGSSGVLTECHGVFVSIHEHGELRGCIGNVNPVEPLFQTTADCAISAAVADPRFMPLALGELPEVDFEISVLSLMEQVKDVNNIEVGKHGLLISKGRARGLLLPQVAAAYGWDRERFLDETSKKAGLRPVDWQSGATIYSFTAFVFSERQLKLSSAS